MEPFDIDSFVKNKLTEDNELHSKEIESSKPFVWTAVQQQINRKKSVTWYHLAAAVLLLLIGFSFILFNIQKGHQREMELLSDQINQLETNHQAQANLLQSKNSQVQQLSTELENVGIQLTALQQQNPAQQTQKILHQVDTVYIKQVEYITLKTSSPVEELEITPEKELVTYAENTAFQKKETDDIIFPSSSRLAKNEQSEAFKIKVGPFARKN